MYHCNLSGSINPSRRTSEIPKRRTFPRVKYDWKGEIKIKQFPDGAFFVEGNHLRIHPRKMETRVPDQIIGLIEESLSRSPADIFNSLVSERSMENVTQMQVYYHWNKAMARKYRRCMDQIQSAVQLVEEKSNMDLWYYDEDHPKAIAFAARIGFDILRLKPAEQLFIDSTCTYFPH